MNVSLRDTIDRLPDSPGVYLMKDVVDRVIYVGKATSLINRVRSYFHESAQYNAKMSALTQAIKTIDYIPTRTDLEALILESSLIKQYRPKYNVMFKDDKSYPMLKLTVQETYPRLFVTRRILPDGAKYYGPYVKGGGRQMLRIIFKLFPIRDCMLDMAKTYARPCIKEAIGLCAAPCVRKVTPEAYGEIVKKLMAFLDGKQKTMAKDFHLKMKEAAAEQDYEEAATYRDLAHMVSTLSIQAEHKVQLTKLAKQESRRQFRGQALEQLQQVLGMPKAPERIEAFDISNFTGDQPVGSMVVFQDGEPLKEDYRHFNIRTVKGIDDFAMMGEIIRRRYTKMVQEGWNFPDLILVDGGKGQLSAAQAVLEELNVTGPTLVSLAKREEELFLPGREASIRLAKDASALHLVQQVRDEAHRFAITHHRKRLRKKLIASVVAQVPGVGPKRTQALLTHVGGLDKLTHASVEELMKAPGVNPALARKIHGYFHPEATEKN